MNAFARHALSMFSALVGGSGASHAAADVNARATSPGAVANAHALGNIARKRSAGSDGGRPRILVVDDNATILAAFRKILDGEDATALTQFDTLSASLFGSAAPAAGDRSSFAVDTATDGRTGLACVRLACEQGRPYAVAFVDMRMPGGWDGLETIEAIWRVDADIQVVICTAFSDYSREQIVARLGRSDRLLILRKPFESIEILQLACALADKWRLQRERQSRLDALAQEVEERTRHLQLALDERQRLAVVIEGTNDIVFFTDPQGEVQYLNHAGREFFGVDHAADPGRSIHDFHPPSINRILQAVGFPAAVRQGVWRGESMIVGKDGTLLPVWLTLEAHRGPDGAPEFFSAIVHDISHLKRFEQELHHRATHDALTGLPNRNLFMDRLHQATAYAKRHGNRCLVCFIDLDRFKWINDSLGHSVGDALLKSVARAMSACLRDTDTLARIGGDEFVLLLPDAGCSQESMHVLERVMAAVARPVRIGGREVAVTCSMGCSTYPGDSVDGEELLRFADAAMYLAKERGRNNLQIYNKDLRRQLDERVELETGLRHAIERGELALHYQPQVDLTDGRIVGVEALMRWRHAELGEISPARFIPVAEETGLIVPLGEWAIREACAQNMAWQRAGLSPVRMAVNLSARQLLSPSLEAAVRRSLAETGLPPTWLKLEITESAAMTDPDQMIPLMQRLHALGVSLSIDDFGTGYSSMHYLKRLPIQELKLDGSFVAEITTDARNLAIADAIIAMAHRLGLRVIAEQAESEDQVALLAGRGCDQVQGYYFSRPLTAEACAERLVAGPFRLPSPAETPG